MSPLFQRASQNGANLDDPDTAQKFHAALKTAAAGRARRYIAGVKAYRRHKARRGAEERPIFWREGTTVLRDYGMDGEGVPVLVVPSLVNRFHILDLAPDHSLLRFLAARGFRPLVVDWDAPGEAEKDFALVDYVGRLARILDVISAAPGQPCHILGYCMGGLLALALAVLKPRQTRSLTLMATPWDFPAAAEGVGPFRDLAAKLEPYLGQWNGLPVEYIEALFAALQPAEAMRKFTRFAAMEQGGDEARRFVLTEDWLNDGVPLTAKVARECLGDLYGGNVTGTMQWRIGKTRIDPRALSVPSYVIVPGKDRLVPPESALPLARLIKGATLHEPMLGHIGLLASKDAPHQVWEPLAKWLEQH